MSDVFSLFGTSGLSFDSTFLPALLLFCQNNSFAFCLLLVLLLAPSPAYFQEMSLIFFFFSKGQVCVGGGGGGYGPCLFSFLKWLDDNWLLIYVQNTAFVLMQFYVGF